MTYVLSHITEPGPESVVNNTFDPLRAYSSDQLHSAHQQHSGKSHLTDFTHEEKQELHLSVFVMVWSLAYFEDDGPVYSTVSPDQNPPSEDDYDDIGC